MDYLLMTTKYHKNMMIAYLKTYLSVKKHNKAAGKPSQHLPNMLGRFARGLTYNNSRPIEVEAFLSKINNLTDEFENMSTTDNTSGINCKYYDVKELSELNFR